MKSLIRILSRYVASAAGIALILLMLNLAVMTVWVLQIHPHASGEYRIGEIAQGLTNQAGSYTLSASAKEALNESHQWVMLLNDSGTLIWSENLPDDVKKRNYTVSEVASFTHWYLKDYPVYVWRHPDGLLVLGGERGSMWKLGVEIPEKVIRSVPLWLIGALLTNGIAAVLLALLFGIRLLRTLRPIVNGINDLADKRSVTLATGGLLGELAAGINKASAQLVQQEAALQKRDDARSTWIAGVSHDIRTPLSMVMGYASQLEENPRLPEAEREQAGIIRKQSEKIKALISDLNLTAKLEYGMQPRRPVSVYLAALVRGVVADFLNGGLDACYSIEVNVEKEAQGAVLIGDEKLLERAISNLIANSIRHNPSGCAVTVTVGKRPGCFSVTVADNGTGFAPEVLESLAASEHSAGQRIHRLGLTIVRQIVRVHGGTAEFRNLPGTGCAVILLLPDTP